MDTGGRRLYGGCCSSSRKPYAREAVLFDEVGRDGGLARTDS